MNEAITVAMIGVVGVVLSALINRGRKENTKDHATVVRGLERIENKIDSHITDHARGDL
jgi:uncharacterized membrane-anchored protein YhcB (DUF1043 family)